MEPHIVCEIRTGILHCVLILCRERRSSYSSMRRSSWRRTSLCSSKSSSWVAPSAICSHTRSRRQSSTPSGPRSLRRGWPTPGMWPGTSSSGGQPCYFFKLYWSYGFWIIYCIVLKWCFDGYDILHGNTPMLVHSKQIWWFFLSVL